MPRILKPSETCSQDHGYFRLDGSSVALFDFGDRVEWEVSCVVEGHRLTRYGRSGTEALAETATRRVSRRVSRRDLLRAEVERLEGEAKQRQRRLDLFKQALEES